VESACAALYLSRVVSPLPERVGNAVNVTGSKWRYSRLKKFGPQQKTAHSTTRVSKKEPQHWRGFSGIFGLKPAPVLGFGVCVFCKAIRQL
jgi:hypothetical protein